MRNVKWSILSLYKVFLNYAKWPEQNWVPHTFSIIYIRPNASPHFKFLRRYSSEYLYKRLRLNICTKCLEIIIIYTTEFSANLQIHGISLEWLYNANECRNRSNNEPNETNKYDEDILNDHPSSDPVIRSERNEFNDRRKYKCDCTAR